MNASGFHEGERAVQARAGATEEAARLHGMLRPPWLGGGLRAALAARTFAVLTARDRDGALWISPLTGEPGFLDGHGTTLTVAAAPRAGDPLHALPVPQAAGLLAIDLGLRRRIRVNGRLTDGTDGALTIEAEQAFGNCPAYIRPRLLAPDATAPAGASAPTAVRAGLDDRDRALIEGADTFFLGTTHPDRGTDASHKGGAPGFVRVEGGELWWPDYAGNNLFTSLGNLTVDPAAALLFLDFTTGRTLHLSGEATVEWRDAAAAGDEGGTGRRVRFRPRRVRGSRIPLREAAPAP
ncbi:pyridoxamine 5'-phosphate oxidase family protein [Streptomyces sp. KAU_LT]|uniref:pyridoxamine 5'-phosphate oxidase family protein n=1 Tax=unclassified Streptomyces TaxID=2593676 RepID=UPI0024B6B9F2|nr:pyridoxamine 5'-phosphate oxidase family protein [Streptomyces sp. KAU_LT]MDI9835415.1 pyridoxamine 5'-phosphate oxidase family protein [Streptomyces sp. KAU_LT]